MSDCLQQSTNAHKMELSHFNYRDTEFDVSSVPTEQRNIIDLSITMPLF